MINTKIFIKIRNKDINFHSCCFQHSTRYSSQSNQKNRTKQTDKATVIGILTGNKEVKLILLTEYDFLFRKLNIPQKVCRNNSIEAYKVNT